MVFLEISNVAKGTVFVEKVTYVVRGADLGKSEHSYTLKTLVLEFLLKYLLIVS